MNIAFAGKDGRSNGPPPFTCIKKKLHDVDGELRRVDEGIVFSSLEGPASSNSATGARES